MNQMESIIFLDSMSLPWYRTGSDEGANTRMKKKQRSNKGGLSRRLSFPDDERRYFWLPLLLDAYAIADTGVFVAVRDEEKKRGKKLACARGCGNCCEHQKDLPLYSHELVGIYWYVSEKMDAGQRAIVRDRLANHTAGAECPFLVLGACAIHPMRPLGCRQFNVFGEPCGQGEDPYYTRRQDVLIPLPEYTDKVFSAVLPFYNLKNDRDDSASIRTVRAQLLNIQTYDWKKLVEILDKAASASRRETG